MSTKHVRTTADLVRYGAGLKIECTSCAAARTFDGFEAARLFGVADWATIRRRARCGRCGAKGAATTILPPI